MLRFNRQLNTATDSKQKCSNLILCIIALHICNISKSYFYLYSRLYNTILVLMLSSNAIVNRNCNVAFSYCDTTLCFHAQSFIYHLISFVIFKLNFLTYFELQRLKMYINCFCVKFNQCTLYFCIKKLTTFNRRMRFSFYCRCKLRTF